MNASAKWKEEIDGSLLFLGFTQLVYVPQPFYMKVKKRNMSIVAVKIVDEIMFASNPAILREDVGKVVKNYEVGTIL